MICIPSRSGSPELAEARSGGIQTGQLPCVRMLEPEPLTYALITPARDEADNLRRLGECLIRQTVLPETWIVVDNGSTDETATVVRGLAETHAWIRLASSPSAAVAQPGQPIVRAVHTGLAELSPVDVVVKLDADVSIDPDYFEKLLAAFAADPTLGIASGQCFELHGDEWRPTHVTGSHVRGATRAWRWECLQAVLPLDDTVPCVMDVVDELKATSAGWRTGIVPRLRFDHHRSVGERDGGASVRWARLGRAAYYLEYRLWYLVVRTGFRALKNPAALAMIRGYVSAAQRREPRCQDRAVVEQLRRQQSLRLLLPVSARRWVGVLNRCGRSEFGASCQSAAVGRVGALLGARFDESPICVDERPCRDLPREPALDARPAAFTHLRTTLGVVE